MKGLRLTFIVFALLAFIIVGAILYAMLVHTPRLIANEPRRIGREYRARAAELAAHPEQATYVGPRRKGWRQAGRIDGRPWGHEPADEGMTRLWIQSGDDEWRAIEFATIRPFPYAWALYGGGALVVFVLLGLVTLAAVSLVREMKSRDDFLAATAHDLTTPLVGLRMMIGRNDDEARKLNERMLLIVSNIKDFLRLGGKRKRPEPREVDIVALCREAYQLFAADYEDAPGGAVTFAETPDGLTVLADEPMTLQILWNLFGNDLKYAAPFGRVEVRFVRDRHVVHIEFVDEGQGMTPRQMARAFDRYYRARTVLASGKGGFGIGLCTAREFAHAMGGDLTVRANTPRGCVFTLSLPRATET